MPTVIDSLLIELGLDTSKFDAAQKKSVEQLRKFDEQQQKTSKKTQEDNKNNAIGFEKAATALSEYFLAYAGVSKIKDFIVNQTVSNTELARSSSLLNMSSRDLKTWGQVAQITGSNVEEMTGTLLGLQESLAQVKRGNPEVLKTIAMLGAGTGSGEAFDTSKSQTNIFKLADAIKAFEARTGDRALALSYARSLNITDKQFLLFEQGGEVLKKQWDIFDKLNKKVNENSESASQLSKEWVKTKAEASNLGDSLYNGMMPSLVGINKLLQVLITGFEKLYGIAEKFEKFKNKSESKLFFGQPNFLDERKKELFSMPENGVSPTGNSPSTQLNSKLSSAIQAAGLHIISGVRDDEKQAALYKAWIASGKKGNPVAPPGKSHHRTGDAADISDNVTDEYLKQYGLYRPHANDRNHIELMNNSAMVGAQANAPSPSRHLSNSSEVNIQNMNISTNANDAAGLARELPRHLENNSLIGSGIGAF